MAPPPGARRERQNALRRGVHETVWRRTQTPTYIDNCYDAIAVLALAVHHAKHLEPKAIRDALQQVANPPGEPVEPGDFQRAFDLISQGKEDQLSWGLREVNFDDHGGCSHAHRGLENR